MLSGVLLALAAGLMWGLVFVAPVMLPQYPAALLAMGRYLAFGLVVLPLAWWDRARLGRLSARDWRAATSLSLIGNFAYYLLLAAAIQRAGGPLASMVIGTLPVVIAISAKLRAARHDGPLPWRHLLPSLLLMAAGIALVHGDELHPGDQTTVSWGLWLAAGAVACWTWYPMRNADWLRAHPQHSASTWATAQGLVTLPLALLGYTLCLWWLPSSDFFPMPLGPQPLLFVGLMLALGLFASWLGTLCWSRASQRLPTALLGQLIVFETLAALAYNYAWRGQWPSWSSIAGMALLVTGVWWALRSSGR